MAIVAKTPHEAEDILRFQPEEFPVFMLDNAHVAGAGTVEIVRQVERGFGTDGKPLERAILTPMTGEETKIVAAAHQVGGNPLGRAIGPPLPHLPVIEGTVDEGTRVLCRQRRGSSAVSGPVALDHEILEDALRPGRLQKEELAYHILGNAPVDQRFQPGCHLSAIDQVAGGKHFTDDVACPASGRPGEKPLFDDAFGKVSREHARLPETQQIERFRDHAQAGLQLGGVFLMCHVIEAKSTGNSGSSPGMPRRNVRPVP